MQDGQHSCFIHPRSLSAYRTPSRRVLLCNRLHEAVDVWGVSKKLVLYLKTKKTAREKADHSSGGGGGSNSSSGWGVWGGAKGTKADGTSSYLDERRREEAERIRGHLDRVARPSQWQGVRFLVGEEEANACL